MNLEWLESRVSEAQLTNLRGLLTESSRHYHDIGHIETLWKRHLDHGGSPDNDIMAFAIAWHDAIYVSGAKDNEARSMDLWVKDALEADRPLDIINAVSEAIMATAEHPYQGDGGEHVLRMADLDLLGFAGTPEDFVADSEAVYREMQGVSIEEYEAGRSAFFEHILRTPRLYRTPDLYALYEDKARQNLKDAIAGKLPILRIERQMGI